VLLLLLLVGPLGIAGGGPGCVVGALSRDAPVLWFAHRGRVAIAFERGGVLRLVARAGGGTVVGRAVLPTRAWAA